MRNKLNHLLFVMFLTLVSSLPVHAELTSPVIAVVDLQQIMRESKASKHVREQMEAHRAKYQAEISLQEQELRDAEKELAAKRSVLSEEAFTEKRRDFEQQIGSAQRGIQERKRLLDQAYTESMSKVRGHLLRVVADIASEKGATMVLSKQHVVIAEKSLDVTTDVLARLDTELPKFDVNIASDTNKDSN